MKSWGTAKKKVHSPLTAIIIPWFVSETESYKMMTQQPIDSVGEFRTKHDQ